MDNQRQADLLESTLKVMLYDIQIKIATRNSFLSYYFKVVGRCQSQKHAYEVCGYLYEILFNEEMFSSYNAFKLYKNRALKK